MNCRRQALQFCLDPAVVVVIQIYNELLFEVFHGLKFLQVQQFALEQPKEILYHSVVQTVAFPAHALLNTFLLEHSLILLVLVLPALVRMKDQPSSIRYLLKSLIQHSRNHTQNRTVGDGIADQIAAAQIKDGREIELLSKQTELCHIRDPFLIRLVRVEIPIQQIGHDFAHFSLVGAIFLHPDTANQAQLLHKPLDSLVVQEEIALVKFCCHAAIAVSPLVFVVNCCDFFFGRCVFVCALYPLEMVVEGGAGQSSDREQNTERVFLP